jgi:tRNA(Ile)-lysidine synthase TilS/MesJ
MMAVKNHRIRALGIIRRSLQTDYCHLNILIRPLYRIYKREISLKCLLNDISRALYRINVSI